MIEFVVLRLRRYSYIMNDGQKIKEIKKSKGTKKNVIKRELKLNYYKDCLINNKVILKLQQRFKSKKHNVYTERINGITLSINDDKILKTFDKITTYPYGTNAFKVYESEMLSKYKWSILMIMQMKTKQNII